MPIPLKRRWQVIKKVSWVYLGADKTPTCYYLVARIVVLYAGTLNLGNFWAKLLKTQTGLSKLIGALAIPTFLLLLPLMVR